MFAHGNEISIDKLPVEYTDIFNERAGSYHFAMANWPQARYNEFKALLECTDFRANQVVLDYPSGGGYLSRYVPHNIELIHLESCEAFQRFSNLNSSFTSQLCQQGKLPQQDETADWILSLAGLHHETNKLSLFKDMARVLKPSGQLVIADARQGSKTALFLDQWVNQYNPMGHIGEYFNQLTLEQLETAGLEVINLKEKHYSWEFESKAQAAHYCQQLFGISLASLAQVEQALEHYLGFDETANGVGLKWQLQFIHCHKRN